MSASEYEHHTNAFRTWGSDWKTSRRVSMGALKWLSLLLEKEWYPCLEESLSVPPTPFGMATWDALGWPRPSPPLPCLCFPPHSHLLPCLKIICALSRAVSFSSQKPEPTGSSPSKGQDNSSSSAFTPKKENQLVTIYQFHLFFFWYPDTLTFKLRNPSSSLPLLPIWNLPIIAIQ